MNKIVIIGIIVVIGFIVVGISLYDASQETISDVTVTEDMDSERKSYSVRLTESIDVNTP